MSASPRPGVRRDFYAVAGELGLLSPQALRELFREATERNLQPARLAHHRGLLDAAQLEIIETLMRPTEVVPGYEILGVLGQGGMGVVYRAQQLNLKRIVALKTVLESQMGQRSALERFEREAQVVARLTHPNIVAAYDFGRHEGRLYFAMELVTGADAGRLVSHRGALDERTVWGIIRQAAAGLAHAAEHGVVHRDIKPANLLLVDPPTGVPHPAGLPLVKIADFGLALLAATVDEQARLTSTNTMVGSPAYMSPEQLLGQPVDLRTDIFALGASAFHMLSGKPPQAGMTLAQIITRRISGAVESVRALRPDVSPASAHLVEAMMVHDASQRIDSYAELARRIAALTGPAAQGEPTLVGVPKAELTRVEGATSTSPWRQKQKWLALAGVLALAAMLVLGIISRGRSAGERDLVSLGQNAPLFNGQNLEGWRGQEGAWGPARDKDGASVLQGNGSIQRPVVLRNKQNVATALEHFRLTLVAELNEADALEVRFDFSADASDQQYLFLRVDAEASTLGRRTGPGKSDWTPLTRLEHSSRRHPGHAIEVERQSQGWWIVVDRQLLGSVPFLHPLSSAEFCLSAEGGNAWFSDITLDELAPAKN